MTGRSVARLLGERGRGAAVAPRRLGRPGAGQAFVKPAPLFVRLKGEFVTKIAPARRSPARCLVQELVSGREAACEPKTCLSVHGQKTELNVT